MTDKDPIQSFRDALNKGRLEQAKELYDAFGSSEIQIGPDECQKAIKSAVLVALTKGDQNNYVDNLKLILDRPEDKDFVSQIEAVFVLTTLFRRMKGDVTFLKSVIGAIFQKCGKESAQKVIAEVVLKYPEKTDFLNLIFWQTFDYRQQSKSANVDKTD